MFQSISPEVVYSIAQNTGRRFGGPSPDTREELTSVAALALCEKSDQIDQARNPVRLAYRIARNAALDAARAARSRPVVPLRDTPVPAPDSADPQTWVPAALDAQAAVQALPPAQQRAVVKRLNDQPLTNADWSALKRLRVVQPVAALAA